MDRLHVTGRMIEPGMAFVLLKGCEVADHAIVPDAVDDGFRWDELLSSEFHAAGAVEEPEAADEKPA